MKYGQRKNCQAKKERIERIRRQCNHNKNTLIATLGENEFNHLLNSFDNSIALLEKEIQALPIHHEYQGTLYLRKPYTEPLEVIEIINGKIVMREDLVSWGVYYPDGHYHGLARFVYKDKALKQLFNREDGYPVLKSEQTVEAY